MKTSFLVALLVLATAGAAFAAPTPKDQTQKLLTYWTADAGAKKAPDGAPTKVLPPELVALFDYDGLVTAAILPHKAQLSNAQHTRYREVFTALLKKTVLEQAGTALADTKIKMLPPRTDAAATLIEVRAEMPNDDVETAVVFTWRQVSGAWKIEDLSIDGSSLVKDYSNQFGRLIKKEGVDGFIGKLEARLAGKRDDKTARL